jgi:hypothetical protein
MKSISLIFLISILSSYTYAAKLECKTSINLQPVASIVLSTQVKNKLLIDDGAEAISYVTETADGVYSIEAYLYSHDLRIYSQGAAGGQGLSLSTWGRDSMLDIVCKQLNK